MTTDLSALRPYKGPIPFVEEDSDRFFGRETDTENLRGMLRTERILLLHSPSGAGKTSLIQAGLIPRMRQDGFRVLPPIRVGHPLPKQASQTPGANRYAYSVMRSVETALSPSADKPAQGEHFEDLADIPLNTYFEHRTALRAPDERLVLVFDQFEEVFTMSPHERSGRLRFFCDLGAVLQDKKIWALFAIKTEYVGALDAYSRFLPNHFAARYYLDFFTKSAAEQAVRKPLEHVGTPFDPEAVEAILADLTRGDGRESADRVPPEEEAPELEELNDAAVIDPLHLQLVCGQVWSEVQRLNLNKVSMDAVVKIREVVGLSGVDAALMQYYDSRIGEAPKSPALSEREIRDWIDEELIQDGRTRRPTLADPNSDSDLARLQNYLEDQHILRASLRGDSKWYELAHDRLVFLIRKSNEEWYDKNLSLFERHARKWRQLGEPQDFPALPWWVWRKYSAGLRGQSEMRRRPEWEKEYLAFCRNRTWKRSVKFAVVPLVLSVVCSLVLYQLWKGQKLENTARRLQALAMQQRYTNQNHDTAILLGRLAKDFRDQAAKQTIRLAPILSSLEVDRAVWTALEADPFSRTLPVEVLGGQPKELMQSTSGAKVLVKNDEGWVVVAIDLLENQVGIKKTCRNGLQSYSPDDDQVAVVEMERRAIRIIRSNCEEIGVLNSPEDIGLKETAPVYSGDGEHLAAFLIDGSLAVYEVGREERQLLGVIPPGSLSCEDTGGGDFPISAITFKKNLIVVGDEGGGIRIFDLAGGHPVIERCLPSLERGWPFYESLKKRKSYRTILALALSNDEPPWLTTVHRGGVNIGGGFILRRSLGGEGPPYPVLPDQKSGQRRGGGQEPRPQSDNPSGEEYLSAYFEPNGRRLVTGGAQGAVMLWDFYEPKFQKKIALDPFDEREEGPDTWDGFVVPFQFLRGMTGAVRAVLYTTAGLSGDADAARNPKARAVVGLDSGAGLRIWDIGFQFKNYLSEDWAGTGYSYALTFHPVFGLITTSNRGKIRTWHIEGAPLSADTGDYAKDLAGKERPLSIRAMDVKDSLMVLGLGDNTAQLLDLANPAFGHTLAGEDGKPVHTAGLWSVRFRPGNGRFGTRFDLATGDYAGKVAFWDLVDNPGGGTTGAVSGSCQFQGRIGELSFHPRGRWLIAGTAIDSDRSMGEPYGELHLVDMEGRACKPSESVACSGGPCVAVTLGQGGKPSSNALTTLTLVRGVAFSKDGTKLAVSGDYGMLRWWNFQEDVGFTTGDPGIALDGARGRVNAVEFVPGDDYKLAAVGQDGFLRIWSLAENENANPLVLKQAGTELHGLAVNQDGRYIAAGDARGRFHLWDLDVNRYICRAVLRNLTWHEWLLAVRDDEKYQVICPNRVPNREIPTGIPPGVEIKKN